MQNFAKKVSLTALVAAASVVVAAGPASAQFDPQWAFHGAPEATALYSSYTLQQVAYNSAMRSANVAQPSSGSASKASGGARADTASSGTKPAAPAAPTKPTKPAKPAVLKFRPAKQLIAPAQLAQSYPAERRAELVTFFGQTLDQYHLLEQELGVRRNDLAGALATFVAGNYIAYRDEPFPDQYFRPLVEQMRTQLLTVSGMQKVSNASKQAMYEHLAIIGTYMALVHEGLAQKPDAIMQASVKAAAAKYLSVLGINPDSMALGSEGFSFG
jgi:hypothetical protein